MSPHLQTVHFVNENYNPSECVCACTGAHVCVHTRARMSYEGVAQVWFSWTGPHAIICKYVGDSWHLGSLIKKFSNVTLPPKCSFCQWKLWSQWFHSGSISSKQPHSLQERLYSSNQTSFHIAASLQHFIFVGVWICCIAYHSSQSKVLDLSGLSPFLVKQWFISLSFILIIIVMYHLLKRTI